MSLHLLRTILLCTILMLCWGCGGDDSGTSSNAGEEPTLSGINPTEGTVGTEVSVSGTNFRPGATIWFNSLVADSIEVASDTTIFALVPDGIDTGVVYTVTVRNSDGTEANLSASFAAIRPELTYINSATKPSGNTGSTVIIEGAAFGDLQGVGDVLFSDGAGGTIAAVIESPDNWTNTFIVTTVPAGANTGEIVVTTATGVSDSLAFTVTQNASFSPSEINWASTSALPIGLSGHQAHYVPVDDAGTLTRYVLVTGGADSVSTRPETYFATIQSNGQLTSWTGSTNLPQPTAFHASTAATPFNSKVDGFGYIYALGGIDSVGGQPMTDVYKASISSSGQIGSWMLTTSLPLPLHSHGAVTFRGSMYLAGGATTDNNPVSLVYRAHIDSLGELSTWEEFASLPSGRSYHGFTSFGGYLHLFGGETGTVSPEDSNYISNDSKLAEVLFMPIDLRTGNLATSAWSVNASSLTKNVSKHSSVVAGGNVLITGGLYNGAGTGSSENSYAQIFSDGTVGSFQGATGAITITSQGGGNLFNHAALSYVDGNGVAHVMVLGGDDANSPGSKHSAVWIY